MNRPRLKLPLGPYDKIMEGIALLGLIILIVMPSIYFMDLPDIVPKHFGANGQPDGYGSKGIIWTLPVLGGGIYLLMSWLNRYPHIYNYPIEVNSQNAKRVYTAATRMIRTLKAITTCSFAYIVYSVLESVLGKQQGLGVYFLPFFIVLILGTLGYFSFQFRAKD